MLKVKTQYYFFAGLLVAILPYCYLCFFAQPGADDFVYAYHFQTENYLDLLGQNYVGWNGRYTSNIFSYLNPIGFGSFFGYKLVSLVMIFLLVCSNFFLIKQVFYLETNFFQTTCSLILSLLFLHNMPIISEGIYWYTGAVIYLLGIVLFLFYFGFLIRELRFNSGILSRLFLTFLLGFCCGFNEVLTLLIVFVLGLISFIFHKNKLENRDFINMQFGVAVFFASIMIFAPGNNIRGSAYFDSHNLSHSIFYTGLQVVRFSLLWLASIPLLASSVLFYWKNRSLSKRYSWFGGSFYLNRWISLSMLFAIIFICVFPPYWATGILGQHRTLNVAYAIFLPIWFINLSVWFNSFGERSLFRFSKKRQLLFGLLFVVGIVFTGNGYNSIKDAFSSSAVQYNIEMNSRFSLLTKEIKGACDSLGLKPLSNQPKCLLEPNLTENPKDWKNQAYNLYFRKDSIKIYIR